MKHFTQTEWYRRLNEKNHWACWNDRENWGPVNRHLWRVHALYGGGDCFLAGFKGAVPHQRLWPSKNWNGKHALPGWQDAEGRG